MAYMDATHWFSTPRALRNMYTDMDMDRWKHSCHPFWHVLASIVVGTEEVSPHEYEHELANK